MKRKSESVQKPHNAPQGFLAQLTYWLRDRHDPKTNIRPSVLKTPFYY